MGRTTEERKRQAFDKAFAGVMAARDADIAQNEAAWRVAKAAPALRDALRAVMEVGVRIAWCDRSHDGTYNPCLVCPACLAWQTAHDALAACEESKE